MSFDVNGNYRGTFYGKDRLGFVTPDCDASEALQPFLPVGYPAPWLPIIRRDEGHPVAGGIVISSGMAVGQDKSGGLVPAGYRSGATGAGSGIWCIVQYGTDDVGFTWNPKTGTRVAAAGEYAVLACPTDATPATVNGVAIQAADITFAKTCDLLPGGVARPVGYALKNVFQYLGGVNLASTTNGMLYIHDSMNPANYTVHNYMHEMATGVRTKFVLRLPWIGATPQTIQTLAQGDGLTGFTVNPWNLSFAHFTGPSGAGAGKLFYGCSVVASDQFGAVDAGSYAPYDSTKHTPDQICGRVIGIEKMWPTRDYLNRVRTQFDRAPQLVGPFAESHPIQMMMGGSATRGADYQINLVNNGILRAAVDAGKPVHDEYGTYIYVHFSS